MDSLGRKHPGRVLRELVKDRDRPYRHVWVTNGPVRSMVTIHSAVLTAFVGPRPRDAVVRHLDGNPANNALTNLAWGTQSENIRDAVRHGTHPETRKVTCPKGHLLEDPNLADHAKRRGRRRCLACQRARVAAQKRGERPTSELADHYYRKIMEAA